MWLKVVTEDSRLFGLVQRVLAELSTGDWQLSVAEHEPFSAADCYIWDYVPGGPLPEAFAGPGPNAADDRYKYFLLIEKKDLNFLRSQFPHRDYSIVLKPATHASLKALLGQALAFHELRNSRSAGMLRADRDELLQSLMQANLKLQEYDQDRTHFLARAAHDFRSPLTAITGYCGLLLGEQLGHLQERQREVLRRMQHSSMRLSRLATGMFQLSVIGRIDNQLAFEQADLRECIDQALCETAQFSGGKQISVSLDFVPPTAPLCFDQSQMEQVLINLLDNACKFTPKFGSIHVRSYPYFWERRQARWDRPGAERRLRDLRSPNSQRVDISDSGPSIPAEQLSRIFEEYTSYGGAQDRSGGGLGLAICKMLLGQHHGAIWADPAGTGGVTFSFVLPLQTSGSQAIAGTDGHDHVAQPQV